MHVCVCWIWMHIYVQVSCVCTQDWYHVSSWSPFILLIETGILFESRAHLYTNWNKQIGPTMLFLPPALWNSRQTAMPTEHTLKSRAPGSDPHVYMRSTYTTSLQFYMVLSTCIFIESKLTSKNWRYTMVKSCLQSLCEVSSWDDVLRETRWQLLETRALVFRSRRCVVTCRCKV